MGAGASEAERVRDALAEVERAPGEPLPDLLRAGRRNRAFLVVSALLGCAAVGAGLFVALPTAFADGDGDVPGAQQVVGAVVSVAGLVLLIWGVVRQLRTLRRQRVWTSPLLVLTGRQRRSLGAQVRGRRDVDPDTLPLARLTAASLVVQRLVMVNNTGLCLLQIGSWMAEPSAFRTVLVVGFVALIGGAAPFVERDARRGRRFLDRYPTG